MYKTQSPFCFPVGERSGATRRVCGDFSCFHHGRPSFRAEIAAYEGQAGPGDRVVGRPTRGRQKKKKNPPRLVCFIPVRDATEPRRRKKKQSTRIYTPGVVNIVRTARGRETAAYPVPSPPRRVSRHTRVLRDITPVLLFRRRAAGSGRFIFARQTSSLPAGPPPPADGNA